MADDPKASTPREAGKLQRRQAILDAARELLAEVGYDSVSLDSIALRADLTKPTVYAYFESREEILLAAYLQTLDFMEDRLREATLLASPRERLSLFVRGLLEANFARRIPLFFGAPQRLLSHPEVLERRDSIRSQVVEILQEGKADGAFAPELDTLATVQFILSVKGIRSLEEFVRRGELSPSELIDHLHQCLLDAICAK